MNRDDIFRWAATQYHIEPDYPWKDGNAVLRHKDSGKWFGVLLSAPRATLHLPGDGVAEVLNVKCDPVIAGSLRSQPGYFPAYHMNKERWVSILLEDTVSPEEIKNLLAISYQLTAQNHKR